MESVQPRAAPAITIAKVAWVVIRGIAPAITAYNPRFASHQSLTPMEAERLNLISSTIADLRTRADEARRYL
jgi:hypothetical protein